MRLRKLTIKNLLPFEEASVDFSKYGMLLIVGDNQTPGADSNGSGKSSILDLVAWAFYGKLLRKIPKDAIIRHGATNGHAVLSFEVAGDVYRIRRYRGSNNRVELHRKTDAGVEDLTAKTPTLTQATINRLTGMDFETFRSVAYFGQRDVSVFAEGTSKDRLEIVGKILGLHIVERAAGLARATAGARESERGRVVAKKERATELLEGLMGSVTEDDWDAALARAQKTLVTRERLLETLRSNLEKAKRADELRTDAEYWASEVQARKDQRSEDLGRWKRQLEKDAAQIEKLGTIKKNIEGARADYAALAGDEDVTEAIAAGQEREVELQTKIAKTSTLRGSCDSTRKKLLEVLGQKGSACPTCRRVIDAKAADAIKEAADELDAQAREYSKTLKKLSARRVKNSEELLRLKEKQQQLAAMQKRIDGLENEMSAIEAAQAHQGEVEKTIEERKHHHDERIFEAKKKLKAAEKACEGLPDEEPDLTEMENDIEAGKLVVEEARSNIATIESAKREKKKLEKELAEYGEQIGDLNEAIRMAKYWADGFPRIRLLVVDSFIPEFESEVNSYLEKLYPAVRVRFETVVPLQSGGTAEKFEILITDLETGRESPWDAWSGGEKKRMALALYLGLNAVASRAMESRIGFLMLDEVLADLDATGREAALELFESEREQDRSIVLISHLPNIQQNFPDVLTVVKRDGIASIRE